MFMTEKNKKNNAGCAVPGGLSDGQWFFTNDFIENQNIGILPTAPDDLVKRYLELIKIIQRLCLARKILLEINKNDVITINYQIDETSNKS
ncbi:unnamed protein product [Cunninghamella echinulata]